MTFVFVYQVLGLISWFEDRDRMITCWCHDVGFSSVGSDPMGTSWKPSIYDSIYVASSGNGGAHCLWFASLLWPTCIFGLCISTYTCKRLYAYDAHVFIRNMCSVYLLYSVSTHTADAYGSIWSPTGLPPSAFTQVQTHCTRSLVLQDLIVQGFYPQTPMQTIIISQYMIFI